MNTADDMREQTGNVRREMEPLRTNQKEVLEMKEQKHTGTDLIHPLMGFISRLDTAKERISELENVSMEFLKTEKQ